MNEFVFPQDEDTKRMENKFQRIGGMTLRDYFAAQALPAIQAQGTNLGEAVMGAATIAFALADAMLIVRDRQPMTPAILEGEKKADESGKDNAQ